jgi:hypothetical protein
MADHNSEEVKDGPLQVSEFQGSRSSDEPNEVVTPKKQSLSDIFTIVYSLPSLKE